MAESNGRMKSRSLLRDEYSEAKRVYKSAVQVVCRSKNTRERDLEKAPSVVEDLKNEVEHLFQGMIVFFVGALLVLISFGVEQVMSLSGAFPSDILGINISLVVFFWQFIKLTVLLSTENSLRMCVQCLVLFVSIIMALGMFWIFFLWIIQKDMAYHSYWVIAVSDGISWVSFYAVRIKFLNLTRAENEEPRRIRQTGLLVFFSFSLTCGAISFLGGTYISLVRVMTDPWVQFVVFGVAHPVLFTVLQRVFVMPLLIVMSYSLYFEQVRTYKFVSAFALCTKTVSSAQTFIVVFLVDSQSSFVTASLGAMISEFVPWIVIFHLMKYKANFGKYKSSVSIVPMSEHSDNLKEDEGDEGMPTEILPQSRLLRMIWGSIPTDRTRLAVSLAGEDFAETACVFLGGVIATALMPEAWKDVLQRVGMTIVFEFIVNVMKKVVAKRYGVFISNVVIVPDRKMLVAVGLFTSCNYFFAKASWHTNIIELMPWFNNNTNP